MAAAAIKATFSDFRIVKGRKVAQLVFETPIESADEALATLGGLPRSDKEAWCGIARLDTSKVQEVTPEKPKRSFAELPIAQQAALLCGREAFAAFLRDAKERMCFTEEEVAAVLRSICGVKSRSELSTNPSAAGRFQTLTLEFEDWMKAPL